MPRTINFEGRRIIVPDDFTDDDISSVLGGGASAAPAAPQALVNTNPRISEFAVSPDGQAPAPSPSILGRENKLGIQGAGRGVADMVGAPVDLATAAINLGVGGLNELDRVLPFPQGSIPRVEKPFLGSDSIADTVSRVAGALGYEMTPPAETFREKTIYNTNRFGANAAGTAGLVTKAAPGAEAIRNVPGIIERLAEPYLKAPGRTVAGDVGASAGAGTATAAGDTYLPESVSHGPAGPLVEAGLAVAGGVGGAGAVGAGRTTFNYGKAKTDNYFGRGVPEKFPVNPETGRPYTKSDIDAAARMAQEMASNPAQAAHTMEGFYNELLPYESKASLPTTGAASGDVGLAAAEKAARTRNSVPFLEQDQRVNTAARRQIDNVGPADQEINGVRVPASEPFLDRAASESDTAKYRAQVTDRVAQQQADETLAHAEQYANRVEQVRRAQGEPIEAARGQGPAASTRLDEQIIDKGYIPARAEKNRQFDTAPGRHETLPADEVIVAAEQVRNRNNMLRPDNQMPEEFIQRIERLAEGNGSAIGGDLADTRKYLATAHEQARASGNFDLADSIATLRGAINRTIETAPGYAEANANYRQFADTYRPSPKDPVGKLTRGIDRDPQRGGTPPSQTAEKLIQPGQPEKTARLQEVINAAENPQAAQTAARDYLLADIAGKNVVDAKTGAIRPNILRRWAADNADNLGLVPGFKTEIETLLNKAQKGERLAGDFANEVRAARQNAKITSSVVEKNALSDLAGSDAVHAVEGIFKSKNPSAAVDDIMARIGNDEAAKNGLKASVREYLIDKATTSAIGKTTDKSNPVSFAKLDELFKQHSEVLSKVLSPEEMNALRRAHKMLGAGKNLETNATSGSNTAEKLSSEAASRMLEAGLKLHYGMLKGGGMMRSLRLIGDTLPSNKGNVQALVAKMWFDPDVAAHLMTRELKDVGTPGWNRKLFMLLGAEAGARNENE